MLNKIFLNSMPKSGTNLVSRALDLASIKYDNLGISEALLIGPSYPLRQLARRSFFERDPITIGLNVQVPVRRAWLDRRLSRVGAGHYITGHANWSVGLSGLLEDHGFRTIVVVRDPRDVLLSQVYYIANSSAHFLYPAYRDLSVSSRIGLALRGGSICGYDVAPFELLLERIDAWFRRSNAVMLKFEDMVGERGGGAVEAQDRTLSLLEDLTGRHFDREVIRLELYGKSHTFRKGRVGSAETELSSVDLARVNEVLGDWRIRWGYN